MGDVCRGGTEAGGCRHWRTKTGSGEDPLNLNPKFIMPRGASPKREREYKKLERNFKKEHRYPGREEEVAARIVNKQRKEYGETKGEKTKDRSGQSPDRNLPIKDYQHLTATQVAGRLSKLSKKELQQVKRYETSHKDRKTVLERLERALQAA